MSDRKPSQPLSPPEMVERKLASTPGLPVLAVLWACVSLACVGLLAASLWQRAGALRHPAPALRQALHQLSMSPGFFAAYTLALQVAVALVFIVVAVVIVCSRPRSRAALVTALILVAFGAAMPGTVYAVIVQQPIWVQPYSILQMIGWALLLQFPYVFPDGRFVPRRMWPVAVLNAIWAIGFFVLAGSLQLTRQQVLLVGLVGWGLCFGLGALAQLYRYRFVSTATERQQTKWVVLGFVAALVGTCLAVTYHVITLLAPSSGQVTDLPLRLAAATLLTVSLALIPLAVGVAILRHRLFDIDVLIHRTLVYGVLTVSLGVTYLALVAVLELATSLFARQGSDVVLVLSTLLIAALFQPWRRRVQAAIDRRFYRGKYDAQRAIESFGATLRTELDADLLRARLLALVDETMRPRSVTLWGVQQPPPSDPGAE